jgi:hypothetical protein
MEAAYMRSTIKSMAVVKARQAKVLKKENKNALTASPGRGAVDENVLTS